MQNEVEKSIKSDKYNGEFNGKMYKNGKVLTGLSDDGKYYKSGKLATGTYKNIYYVSGEAFDGTKNNTKYVDGKKLTGICENDGLYYKNGKIYSGILKSGNATANYKKGELQYLTIDSNDKNYPKAVNNVIQFSKSNNLTLATGETGVIQKDGTVVITSKDKKTVTKYDTEGNQLSTIKNYNKTSLPCPAGGWVKFSDKKSIQIKDNATAVIQKDGTVVITSKDKQTVTKYDTEGNQLSTIKNYNETSLPCPAGGWVKFSDKKSIQIKDNATAVIQKDGTVVITSKDKQTVTKYDTEGNQLSTIINYNETSLPCPAGGWVKFSDKKSIQIKDNATAVIYSDGLVEVTSKDGNTVTVIRYDANGNIKSQEATYYENGNIKSQEATYYANGKKTTDKLEYDTNGNIASELYTEYSDIGKISQKIEYDSNGAINSDEFIEYDESGNINKRTKFLYDENGNNKHVESTYYDKNSKVSQSYIAEYFENGISKLYNSKWVNQSGKIISSTKSEHYENGSLKYYEIISYDKNGKISHIDEYEYDEDEKKLSCKLTNYDENGKMTSVTEEKYDSEKITSSIKYEYTENGILQQQTITNYSYYFYKSEDETETSSEGGISNITSITKNATGQILAQDITNYQYSNGSSKFCSKKQTHIDYKNNKNNFSIEKQWSYDENNSLVSIIEKSDTNNDGIYENEREISDLNYLSSELQSVLSYNLTAELTDRILEDIQIVKNAEKAGLFAGAKGTKAYEQAYNNSIKSQMIKTESNMTNTVGEVVEKADGLYVNNGTELVKLNISAETYLALFPPIQRYDISQGNFGDCYFIAGCVIGMMKNPTAFAQILQMFSENENGDITIQFAGTLSSTPITFTKGELETLDGVSSDGEQTLDKDGNPITYTQVTGSKGLQLLE